MKILSRKSGTAATTLLALALMAGAAQAATLAVTVTNNQTSDGLYLTPVFSVFHDGSFSAFTPGAAASASLESLAETGSTAGVTADAGGFSNTTITAPGGFAGAPVLDPGESVTVKITVDALSERFFSFLSMIIPSNDTFIGNDNATAYEVFDAGGNFTNIGPIVVTDDEAWDAGTEVDDGLGAAFSTDGGVATDQNGVVAALADLSFLDGINTPVPGAVSTDPLGSATLATITIAPVPLPAGGLLLIGAFGALGVAKRRSAKA